MKVLCGFVLLCLALMVSGYQQQGHGIQVVDRTSDHKFQLNENALRQILLREDVKNLPVVLVSVAGAYRGGKSFLLNFFLRYLMAPEETRNESGDWLGSKNEGAEGFDWRSGSDPHTTGILMWSEPIITTLSSGDKVAVLLMDTQGAFDSSSTVQDCSTIFALSTLLSSVQIYNIKENINEYHLQHLQLFAQYGQKIKNQDGTKAFQVLEFLVRDWQFDDHPYGQKGGEDLLAKRLEVTPGMHPELRELRDHIRSSFETIKCFLMPHPGLNVRKRNFTGRLTELDDEFKHSLMELVPSIFAPSNLIPKMINGEKVKARDLFTYFTTYMRIFNSDKVPTVTSMVTATAQAALLAAVRDARELYEASMKRVSDDPHSLPSQALNDEHLRAIAAAQAAFRNKRTMASRNQSDAYFEQMSQELADRLSQFELINQGKLRETVQKAKETYDTAIQHVHGQDLLCLHPKDLEDVHNDAVKAALKVFDDKRKSYPSILDPERMKLVEILKQQIDSLRNTNELHNKIIVSSVRMEFSSTMQALLSTDQALTEDEFNAKYEEAKAQAIAAFESKRNKPTQYEDDPSISDLLKALMTEFFKLEKINRSQNRLAFQIVLEFYTNSMKQFWNGNDGRTCLHPGDLLEAHQSIKAQAIKKFRPNKVESEDSKNLAQILESKYYELKEQNDALNEMAISAALNRYVAYMEEKCQFNPWWLLVVPKIVHTFNKPQFHKEAHDAAVQVFYERRRASSNSAQDVYLKKLENKIKEASGRFFGSLLDRLSGVLFPNTIVQYVNNALMQI